MAAPKNFKPPTKEDIAQMYLDLIEEYREFDSTSEEAAFGCRVRPLDYLAAIKAISQMYGHDKPIIEDNESGQLTLELF